MGGAYFRMVGENSEDLVNMTTIAISIGIFIAAILIMGFRRRRSNRIDFGRWSDWMAGKVSGEVARQNAVRFKAFIITLISIAIIGGFSYYFDYGQYFRQYFGVEQSALISASLAFLSVLGLTVFFRILFSAINKDFFDATVMILSLMLSIGATCFSSLINIDVTLSKKDIKLAQDLNIAADIEMYRASRNEYIRQTALLDGSRGWPQTKAANLAGQKFAEEQIMRLERKLEISKDFNYYFTGYIPGFAPALPLLLVLWAIFERKRAGLYKPFKTEEKSVVAQIPRAEGHSNAYDVMVTGMQDTEKRKTISATKRKRNKSKGERDERREKAWKELVLIIERNEFVTGGTNGGRPKDGAPRPTIAILCDKYGLKSASEIWLRRRLNQYQANNLTNLSKNGTNGNTTNAIVEISEINENGKNAQSLSY